MQYKEEAGWRGVTAFSSSPLTPFLFILSVHSSFCSALMQDRCKERTGQVYYSLNSQTIKERWCFANQQSTPISCQSISKKLTSLRLSASKSSEKQQIKEIICATVEVYTCTWMRWICMAVCVHALLYALLFFWKGTARCVHKQVVLIEHGLTWGFKAGN